MTVDDVARLFRGIESLTQKIDKATDKIAEVSGGVIRLEERQKGVVHDMELGRQRAIQAHDSLVSTLEKKVDTETCHHLHETKNAVVEGVNEHVQSVDKQLKKQWLVVRLLALFLLAGGSGGVAAVGTEGGQKVLGKIVKLILAAAGGL